MVIQYRHIRNVSFPVYQLSSDNWYSQDGLLFLDGIILDDNNMSGNTLGIRRLQSPQQNLFRLDKQIDDFRALLRCSGNYFIDTKGRCFIYEKTKFCKLRYYKIKSVNKKSTACLLKLSGVKTEFTIPRPPPSEALYAGVLLYEELPWLLYEYSTEKLKDTRRKV